MKHRKQKMRRRTLKRRVDELELEVSELRGLVEGLKAGAPAMAGHPPTAPEAAEFAQGEDELARRRQMDHVQVTRLALERYGARRLEELERREEVGVSLTVEERAELERLRAARAGRPSLELVEAGGMSGSDGLGA